MSVISRDPSTTQQMFQGIKFHKAIKNTVRTRLSTTTYLGRSEPLSDHKNYYSRL